MLAPSLLVTYSPWVTSSTLWLCYQLDEEEGEEEEDDDNELPNLYTGPDLTPEPQTPSTAWESSYSGVLQASHARHAQKELISFPILPLLQGFCVIESAAMPRGVIPAATSHVQSINQSLFKPCTFLYLQQASGSPLPLL